MLVQIDEILFEQKRISLGLPAEAVDESWNNHNSKSGFSNSGLNSLATILNNSTPNSSRK